MPTKVNSSSRSAADEAAVIHHDLQQQQHVKSGVTALSSQQQAVSPTFSTVSGSSPPPTSANSTANGAVGVKQAADLMDTSTRHLNNSQTLIIDHNNNDSSSDYLQAVTSDKFGSFNTEEAFAEIDDESSPTDHHFIDQYVSAVASVGATATDANNNHPRMLYSHSASTPNLRAASKRPADILTRVSSSVNIHDPRELCYDDLVRAAAPPTADASDAAQGTKKNKEYQQYNTQTAGERPNNELRRSHSAVYNEAESRTIQQMANAYEDLASPPPTVSASASHATGSAQTQKSGGSCRLTEQDIVNSLLQIKSKHGAAISNVVRTKLDCIEEKSTGTLDSTGEQSQVGGAPVIDEFIGHPYFPLLRDLTTAITYFGSPTMPGEMLFNLPTDVNMLLYNFCMRNKLDYPSYTNDHAKDERIYMLISDTHGSLIGQIEQRKLATGNLCQQQSPQRNYSTSALANKLYGQSFDMQSAGYASPVSSSPSRSAAVGSPALPQPNFIHNNNGTLRPGFSSPLAQNSPMGIQRGFGYHPGQFSPQQVPCNS